MLKPFIDRFPVGCLVAALLAGCTTSAPATDDVQWVSAGAPAPVVAATQTPEVRPGNEAAFAAAVLAMQEGRLAEAEVLLLELVADQPELAGPWTNLGRVYLAQGNLEAARHAYENAVKANPGSCEAHNQLGVLDRQAGQFSTAEAHYLACLERLPDFEDAYLNLGILYELYLGRLDDALAVYRQYQAVAVQPDERVKGWVIDLERRLGV